MKKRNQKEKKKTGKAKRQKTGVKRGGRVLRATLSMAVSVLSTTWMGRMWMPSRRGRPGGRKLVMSGREPPWERVSVRVLVCRYQHGHMVIEVRRPMMRGRHGYDGTGLYRLSGCGRIP